MLFSGRLDKPGTVTVASSPATMNNQTTNFVGYANVSTGTNTVQIVAQDYNGNSRTNNYQVIVAENGVARTLLYDLNGNLTNVTTANSTNTYAWDAANRLVSITRMSGSNPYRVSQFTYDGLGRRVEIDEFQNNNLVIAKKFVWCGTELCEERDATGANVTKRFFPQGEQIAGTNCFFTRDHLGSIREMTDSSGTTHARYDYDPYGRRTKVQGDLDADFGFTGLYFHATSRLHLALYRAYDADMGRWLNRDPLREHGGLNLYGYVGNNPIMFIDPYGLGFLGDFGNGLNNTVSAMGQLMGQGLYDLTHLTWSPNEYNRIADLMYSLDTPENPAATPYIEGTLGATVAVEGALLAGAAAFTAGGTSIFYSGAGAECAATGMAEAGGGSTILDTLGGSALRSLGVQNQTVWRTASWFYANTTGSQAIVVVGENGGVAGTVLGDVELPTLGARGVNVIYTGVMNTAGF